MKYILEYQDHSGFYINPSAQLSEGLQYHYSNKISLTNSVYRIGSESWLDLVKEARSLWEKNLIELNEDDFFLISTDAGIKAIYEENEVLLEIPFEDENAEIEDSEEIEEAKLRGREVKLNKPFRTPGGPRKFSVYTKNERGNVVKVSFGQPGMKVNNADPEKARSFRKRMRCDEPGPKWKPKYWACNVGRYAKLLGLSSSRPW
jgi:hypothetical protein